MTRRRRGKRGRTSPDPPTKRRRGGAPEIESNDYPELVPTPAPAAPQPSSVMVAGLPPGCGVLELKSRLEAYGPIARARVDASAATGYVTFRSGAAAVAAIAASLDPGGGIAIGSKKVDKLVYDALKCETLSKGATQEIESFNGFLTDTKASFKQWSSRLKQALETGPVETEAISKNTPERA